jgi:aryl carrier-like protein
LTRDALLAVEPGKRQEALVSHLRQQVARVLGLAPSKLDVQQPLNRVGLDSLMAVELKNRIEVDLGIALPTVELLEGPSITQLATRLLNQLGAASTAPVVQPAAPAGKKPTAPRTAITQPEAEALLARRDELSTAEVDTLLGNLLTEEQKE